MGKESIFKQVECLICPELEDKISSRRKSRGISQTIAALAQ
jgi:hypothetical protein